MNLQGNVGQITSGVLSGKLIKNLGTQTQIAVDQNKLNEANKRITSLKEAFKTLRDVIKIEKNSGHHEFGQYDPNKFSY